MGRNIVELQETGRHHLGKWDIFAQQQTIEDRPNFSGLLRVAQVREEVLGRNSDVYVPALPQIEDMRPTTFESLTPDVHITNSQGQPLREPTVTTAGSLSQDFSTRPELIIDHNGADEKRNLPAPESLSDVPIIDHLFEPPLQPMEEANTDRIASESELGTSGLRLELSMLEPGSRAAVLLIDRMFGLEKNGLMTREELAKLLSPTREHDELVEAEIKPGHEVILMRKNERERLAREYPAAVLDSNFFSFIADMYGITDRTAAEQFYLGNMNLANKTVNRVRQLLPFSQGSLGVRNEIDPPQHFPSGAFHLLISELTHPITRYEQHRQLALWLIAAEFTASKWNYRMSAKLNDIMRLMDEKVFAGLTGEAHDRVIHAWHDKQTGRVNRIDEPESKKKPPQVSILKKHTVQMRSLLDMDEVAMIDLNEKELEVAILKSILKANDPEEAERGKRPLGVIEPLEQVTDLARLVVVVDGGREQVMNVMNRVRTVMENPESYEFLSEVKVKEDHKTNGRKGQSRYFKNWRLQLEFDDLPVDDEMQFFDIRRYLNSQLAIGHKRKDGTWDGEAYDLHKPYQLMRVFRTIFPKDLYPDPKGGKTYEQMILDSTDQIAAGLLERVLEGKSA